MPQPERSPEQDASHRLERGLAALDAGLYLEAFDDLAWVQAHCPDRVAGARAVAALAAVELDPRNETGRPGLGTALLGRFIQDPARPEWAVPLAETSYLLARALGAPPAEGEPQPEVAEAEVDTAAADSVLAVSADSVPVESADSVASDTVTADSLGAPSPAVDSPRVRLEQVLPPRASEAAYGCGAEVDTASWTPPPLPQPPGPSLLEVIATLEGQRDAMASRADTLVSEVATLRRRLTETENELERIRKTLRP